MGKNTETSTIVDTSALAAAWQEYKDAADKTDLLMVDLAVVVVAFITSGGKAVEAARVMGKSEGYVSKLRKIGEVVTKFPTLTDDERRGVARTETGNDGHGDKAALRKATTVAQVRKAVKPVNVSGKPSGGKSLAERIDALREEITGKAYGEPAGKDAPVPVILTVDTLAALSRFGEMVETIGEAYAANVA